MSASMSFRRKDRLKCGMDSARATSCASSNFSVKCIVIDSIVWLRDARLWLDVETCALSDELRDSYTTVHYGTHVFSSFNG
jgi:hypothetical protein